MSDRLDELGHAATRAARQLAARQAEAVGRYGQVLRGFSRGDMSPAKYGAQLVSFSFNESLKYAQTVADVGSSFLKSAIIIIGGSVADQVNETERAVRDAAVEVSNAPTPRAKPAAKPARRRSRQATVDVQAE